MSLIVPQDAEIDTLNYLITNMLDNANLRLYKTSITLGPTTTLATLVAAEATFTGYSPSPMTGWSSPVIDGTGHAATTSNTATFTPTSSGGSGNLYGYFITDATNAYLIGCEAFASPPVTVSQGIAFNVPVTYTVLSEF